MEERLQKYMARCGVDSRRKCEELIAAGLVELNGEVVREPGVKVDPMRDDIRVNGKKLRIEKPAHYIHYKVKGVTTTVSDDLGRRTVMDCLPDIRERVYPVGRLDKESEGLLVLTNDGALANYLTHPAHGVAKTYRVVAEGRIGEDVIAALAQKGMRLGPVLIKPSRVELVRYDNDNTVVLISVSEGINREVRRIFAALGHEVKKLLRTQVGPIGLTGMKRGATRPMTAKELSLLKKGMEGMAPEDEIEDYPPGSAKSRRPAGPRGRPRRGKVPRQGKPDPAAMKPAPKPKGRGKGKGDVVVDDWQKRRGAKAKPKSAPAAKESPGKGRDKGKAKAAAETKKPLKTLRPKKKPSAGAPRDKKPGAGKKPAAPGRAVKKTVRHPLAIGRGRRGESDG